MRVAPKWLAVLSVAVLASCTSSGGNGPTTTYTVGGTVTGLAGSGLVLENNGGSALAISANGTFTFGTALASGATYSVTVASQPAAQVCSVANGSGTVGSSNVTNVAVVCTTVTHTVGGTVSGLAGSGLVLQNGGGDNVTIASNGAFTFPTPVSSGASYAVTVLTQPTAPSQTCTVTNGSGTMGSSNVTNVAVTCVTGSYTIGGTVSGLAGSGLVLQNNGGDNLAVSANGGFTFPASVSSGASYAVTVLTQPGSPTQICTVANGAGIVGGANVTSVAVVCASQTYTVGGTVSGLATGATVVLQNNGGNNLTVGANGAFTFTSRVASGGAYAVTVLTQPSSPAQTCTVTNGTGFVASANVTGVTVTCVTRTFTIGGTVTGLAGSGLVLQNNGGNNLAVAASGAFTFTAAVASGSTYAVTVLTQPGSPAQTCGVSAGTGTVGGANVTNVVVTCVTSGFTVGGTVTGLDGTGLVLRNNGGDSLTVSANGAFTFPTPVVSGGAYLVTVFTQPTGPAQVCTVGNGSGTVGGANVTNVTVSCPPVVLLQKWQAPVAWGGTATSFWPDGDPDLVEHLVFDPILHETGGIVWSAPDGLPVTNNALTGVGSLGVTRYGAGPFNVAPGSRYVAATGDGVLDVQGDLLVCAVVKPDWNPVVFPADDSIIIAKGERGVAGWALMQSSVFFSFRYQSSSGEKVAALATDFAMPLDNPQGPINPSYVVVCGGRDAAGGTLSLAANSRFASPTTSVPPTDTMVTSLAHASVGGYAVNDLNHDYGGRVYETAVWKIPATRANIEAKTAAILGLFMPDGSTTVTYVRDREGYYPGVGTPAPYHTAWKNQPRIDPTGKGFLFGLQANNRVQYPEALQLWSRTPAAGAGAPVVTPNDALPPGDADVANAARILLPAGASLSLPLTAFGNPGAAHGQIWVRAVGTQTGTLTVASDVPGTVPPTPLGSQDIPLAALTTWTHVQFTGINAAPPTSLGTVYLRNDGATPIEFHAWGVVLTQLGRDIAGVDAPVIPLGFDPGPTLYNSLVGPSSQEVLTLPALRPSTASTGFCIGADAQPPAGMTWQGPFFDRRTLMEWAYPPNTEAASQVVKIMVMGTAGGHQLEMFLTGTVNGFVKADLTVPVDTSARIKGCVAPNGTMTLYVDDVALTATDGSPLTGPTPDLAGGALSVGSDHTGTEPWQGYVKAAVACRLSGTLADCR